MKRIIFLPVLLMGVPAVAVPSGCAGDVTEPARNPVIWADVPDPSVIRVGDIYYMSSTTMHMSPGLPLMKSRDLVHWEIVSYAYETLADSDALQLEDGRDAYGQGSWASSLRHHDGLFYVSTFSSTTGKTHIYKTRDIEEGPWEVLSFAPSLHDHSLFFDDDGRVYMVYGGGDIHLTELLPDLSGIKPGGVDKIIIQDASAVAGADIMLPAEGSQMLKVDGRYYLLNITWPRNGMRTVIVHRADSIAGPYEGRVALQDKGVAQGSLIDTPGGDWYAFLFQDNGAVGRTPFLVPVRWEEGWPVMGVDGKVPMEVDIPAGTGGIDTIVASDEFERRPGERALPLAWQWNHNPDAAHWSLDARPGHLRLINGRLDADLVHTRNTLTQRTWGPQCSAITELDVTHMKEGDVAGLAAFQKEYGFVGVEAQGASRSLVMVRRSGGPPTVVERVPLRQGRVRLRVECDFRQRADIAHFYYSMDGGDWIPIGEALKMEYTLPHFMGYRFGLFSFATKESGGFVDFDYFRIGDTLVSGAEEPDEPRPVQR